MPAIFTLSPMGQITPASPWAANTTYAAGSLSSNDTTDFNTYYAITGGKSASSGGPTGTGTMITDNTVVWAYVGPTFPVMYKTVNAFQPDDQAYSLFVNSIPTPSPSNPTDLSPQYLSVWSTDEMFKNGAPQINPLTSANEWPGLYARMAAQFG